MRSLTEPQLKEDHHLKHGGRQQLGLFLKGIGLTLDDALRFWRSEMCKRVSDHTHATSASHPSPSATPRPPLRMRLDVPQISVEAFDKQYAYNVRHNFGKEGKRTDYTPYTCMKIISATPGVGDHHGCPYSHFSEENLRAALGALRLPRAAEEEALAKVRGHHYQLACAAAFEGVHGALADAGINHPNQYFDQSRKLRQPLAAGDKEVAHSRSPATPQSAEPPQPNTGAESSPPQKRPALAIPALPPGP
eukprot:SM000037S13549  [mRNA]  locus=s37:576175:577456:- [translate_table: standard]